MDLPHPYIYTRTKSKIDATLLFCGGILMFAVAGAGFFVAMFSRTSPIALQTMTTVPVMIGLGLWATAYLMYRSPLSVTIDAAGVTLAYRQRTRVLRWQDISLLKPSTAPITNKKGVTLYGNSGQSLVNITSDFEDFDGLKRTLEWCLAQHPNPSTQAVQWRKAKRNGIGLVLGGIFAIALAIAVVAMAWFEERDRRQLAANGVEGTATVVAKRIAPNGYTRRIDYRVNTKMPDGSSPPEQNVELESALWEKIAVDDSLPVRYMPANPGISRLVEGQIDDGASQPFGLSMLLGCALTVLGLFIIGGGILSLRGIDLQWDKNNFNFKVVRLQKLDSSPPGK